MPILLSTRRSTGANFNPLAAAFDGSADYMTRGVALTGDADGKAGTFSCFFNLQGGAGSNLEFVSNSGQQFEIVRHSSNTIRVNGYSAGVSLILQLISATTISASGWHHLLTSWNLATGTGYMYIDDAADLAGSPTLTNDTIDYANANFAIGATPGGSFLFNGYLAEVWMSRTFIDISVVANRRFFVTAALKPVDLGVDGSNPGVTPIVYQSIRSGGAATDFATNLGTGGNFTITGTLDLITPSPWA